LFRGSELGMNNHDRVAEVNESLKSKEPIDPSSDVEEFKEKFAKKKMYNNELVINEPRIKGILDKIVNSDPTMTSDWKIYGVFNTDDNGRKQGNYMFYVKAVSKNHARIKGATRNGIEIISTGYYGAELLSDDVINARIDGLENEINLLKNPL
jgi:hypothetical protein